MAYVHTATNPSSVYFADTRVRQLPARTKLRAKGYNKNAIKALLNPTRFHPAKVKNRHKIRSKI